MTVMTRWRRLLRARCSVDLTIVALVLCVSIVIIKRLSEKHVGLPTASGDLNDDGGQLLEISVGEKHPRRQQQQHHHQDSASSSTSLAFHYSQLKQTVDQRILQITDFRSASCHAQGDWSSEVSVTLVVEYSDYEFYDIKNTVDSCVIVHASSGIKQIVAVDSSTLDYIIDEARAYFSRLPAATLVRSADVRLSSAQARTAGLSVAKGDVVVFVDSSVICAAGWLDPLVQTLLRHPDSIVSPHYDRVRDPVSLEYERTDDGLVAGMSWDLTVRMRGAAGEMRTDDGCCVKTPALRGNMVAVGRRLFDELGGYDPRLAAEPRDAGHNVELSLRAWMCGLTVYTVPCSRVGVLNLRDPVKVTDINSVMYIASMWLKPKLSIVVNSAQYTSDGALSQTVSTGARRSIARCDAAAAATSGGRGVDWFLNHVATDLILPSLDAVKFGMLRVSTGRCARLLTDTRRLSLQDCLQNVYVRPPKEMTFELSRDGQLRVTGLCVTVQSNAYLLAKDCVKGESHQTWKYSYSQLHNAWSRYCATHVTDPDTKAPGDRQIAMAQDCGSSNKETAQFRTWQFIAN